jgi:hypothetical protein
VPWSYEYYTVWALNGEDIRAGWVNVDSDEGPPLPISAYAEWYNYESNNTTYALSEITDTSFFMECSGLRCMADAEFTGRYTAGLPFFVFSFDFQESPLHNHFSFSLTVSDLTAQKSLHNSSHVANVSDVFYIPTPVGDEIEVNLYMYMEELVLQHSSTLNYEMRTSVSPEPISSTLFVIGGALLGGRCYLRRKKNAYN